MNSVYNMRGGGEYVTPYTSLVYEDDSVHYNVFKAQLTLANKRIITIPQNGNNTDSALTSAETAEYKADIVDVAIGNRVKTLGNGVFLGCSKLENIDLPNSVKSINQNAFSYCRNLVNINIPSGVTSIGASAFTNCSSITSITIPSGLTSIGARTFYGCSSLTDIEIPSGVTNIGNSAFYGCSGLTSIIFNDVLLTISNSAFRNCSGLTSIELPSSITSIELYAFNGCTNLSSITVLATTPPTLGVNVFYVNASGRKIYVPQESVEAYKTATNWSTYASAILPIPNEL